MKSLLKDIDKNLLQNLLVNSIRLDLIHRNWLENLELVERYGISKWKIAMEFCLQL